MALYPPHFEPKTSGNALNDCLILAYVTKEQKHFFPNQQNFHPYRYENFIFMWITHCSLAIQLAFMKQSFGYQGVK